jgi:hypothetical protein
MPSYHRLHFPLLFKMIYTSSVTAQEHSIARSATQSMFSKIEALVMSDIITSMLQDRINFLENKT